MSEHPRRPSVQVEPRSPTLLAKAKPHTQRHTNGKREQEDAHAAKERRHVYIRAVKLRKRSGTDGQCPSLDNDNPVLTRT
jgi:hypothetical protein